MAVVLPQVSKAINANLMTDGQLHMKLEKGYADIETGKVHVAAYYKDILDDMKTG